MYNFSFPGEEEFRRWIKESIREEFKSSLAELKSVPNPEDELLVTRKEIGKYLKISLVTLSDWQKRGLPFHQNRGRVLFLKSEVLKWLKGVKGEE
jgi:hypothetical protein